MQTYPHTFAAGGETLQLNVPGRYLVILRLDSAPVNITLFHRGRKLSLGELVNWTTGPLAGLEVGPLPAADESGAAFDRVEIVSTGADTLVVGIGDGSVRYQRAQGSVALTSPLVMDDADNQVAGNNLVGTVSRMQAFVGAAWSRLRGVTPADAMSFATTHLRVVGPMMGYNGATSDLIRADNVGGAGSLRVTQRGFTFGAAYASNTLIAANGTSQVFAPGSNTNGAIVWAAGGATLAASGNGVALLAKTAAPTTLIDGDPIHFHHSYGNTIPQNHDFVGPVLIASGKGLYFYSQLLETLAWRRVLYTLL